jgi:AbrB family looped-hinge helix DNA binding protein
MCHTQGVNPVPVHVGAKGRVVLPAPIRRALGLEEGDELLARVEGNAVVLEPRSAAVGRLRTLVRSSVPAKASLVEELLSERRAAARRERGA